MQPRSSLDVDEAVPARSIVPTFIISVMVLGLAAFSIFRGDDQALGGAIVGYVAAYWLPAVRVVPQVGGPLDG